MIATLVLFRLVLMADREELSAGEAAATDSGPAPADRASRGPAGT